MIRFLLLLFCCFISLNTEAQNGEKWFKKGESAYTEKQYLDAFYFFSKAIESKYKPLEKAYLYRGSVSKAMGKYDDAISDYNQALELVPDMPEAYCNRANVRYLQKKYKEATGQGLQKKATPIREGVIVISEETTIQQLQDLAEKLEERF